MAASLPILKISLWQSDVPTANFLNKFTPLQYFPLQVNDNFPEAQAKISEVISNSSVSLISYIQFLGQFSFILNIYLKSVFLRPPVLLPNLLIQASDWFTLEAS